ncbi:hypothetical protein CHLNCDRAFT_52944 [Chlorella variabilis]|uniref:Thioredoxin-like fold domain-containing protein n=1 Tax=Chlorella variabilis TaxID=554065 RepID=E1ZHN4_CHLVA|nr:hypothetical protein CHLNCDRAFT_52944 [Chlorella variabilis]EFN54634.1 hypothetical protein CHLNCDRAFT_52944 [Chlorella variabilis]|eukprot:XP_005846736.1 hypothetical protein CHLNCDRAFT_52944 [Chlorella variabilis]
MSRTSTVASLCRRAATALAQRTAAPLPAAAVQAPRTIVTATAATAAAASGTMMRVMGVDVPYSYVIGTALAIGFGAYTYETFVLAKEGGKPIQAEITRHPDITSLRMTDHNGRPFTAQQLLGRWALIDFGSLQQATDVKSINSICRAAEAARQRCGVAVTPVYLSLSPATDKPDDLKRVVAAAGHPALVALTGDADGVLECAHKFKSQEKAAVLSSTKGDEQYKRGDAAMDEAYVSSFVYLVAPNGEFSKLWPKEVPLALLSDAVCRAVKD